MPIDELAELAGEFVVKSLLGKPFDEFRNTMKKEKLEEFCKKSYFGHFIEMPEDNNARGGREMDEIWINYCDMPICFGIKEFAIVTGLRCDRPKEPLIKEMPHKNSKESRTTKPPLLNKGKALSK
ncbi:putative glycerol-3-phosphate 2-O-acyltransferase 6-like [Capsicum annuum]|nr:putative glycerol-3-phosphate 2-O-acyltransferase 6-like [Capsicum annuum]KAF3655115.1 putative glycerol-3-phosphate 2-O-acyltransferase 6-like [Capsicum annuum]